MLRLFAAKPLIASRFISSTTRMAMSATAGKPGKDLVKALENEIKFENENGASPRLPEELQEFLSQSAFKVADDQEGMNRVRFTRQHGNELVNVTLNIVPEVASSEEMIEDEESIEDDIVEESSLSMTIDVTKKDGDKDLGTLTFYAVTSGESGIYIEDVEFSNDSKMVTAEDNVSEFQRKSRYLGPRFDDLDEELQFSFSEFLEERGLNENFCNFAQDYAEWKEQNEYKRWLNNVKSFVTK